MLPSEFIRRWISGDEFQMKKFTFGGTRDEGQIMKVIDLKKEPKNSRLNWYSLQSHMKSHEKKSIHPIALPSSVSTNISSESSLEDETKSLSFLICQCH